MTFLLQLKLPIIPLFFSMIGPDRLNCLPEKYSSVITQTSFYSVLKAFQSFVDCLIANNLIRVNSYKGRVEESQSFMRRLVRLLKEDSLDNHSYYKTQYNTVRTNPLVM